MRPSGGLLSQRIGGVAQVHNKRRFARVGLTLLIMPIFLATALLSSQQPALSQTTTITGAAPLDVPEDSLGLQPEQTVPEVSVAVDARDGHLVVRVVDVWGPGQVPLVMRSWTGTANSAAGADPLLRGPALVVEPHDRPTVRLQGRHDEAHTREQFLTV